MRLFAIVALTLGAVSAASSFAAEVGTTAGEFSVGASGSANYSIPISVPPGVGGLTPSLSLQYDSAAGDGLMGRGFTLGGLSQITRCNRTRADDGYLKGVEFNATDAFCLDGERLVAISGTYGAPGTEYRTQIDGFSKIVSMGGTQGDPGYWRVWSKSGLVMDFGGTDKSRIEADNLKGFVWAVNRIADSTGNQMTVDYDEYSYVSLFLPRKITYAGGAAAVYIDYEYRSDPTYRFLGGAYVRSEFRISKVSTYAGGAYTREYRMGYNTPSVAGGTATVNRLLTVTECDPRTNSCFNPTRFDWATAPAANTTLGAAHYVSADRTYAPLDMSRVGYADFNGDGRTDVYRMDSSNQSQPMSIYTYRADGGQDYSQGPPVYISSDAAQFAKDIARVKPADFDADGTTDFLIVNGNNVNTPVTIYRKSASGFNVPTAGPSFYVSLDAKRGKADVDRLRVVDLNGDGLPDIHVINVGNTASTIYYNQGFGIFGGAVTGPAFGVAVAFGTTDDIAFDQARIRYGDFNGDGLTDIYVIEGCNRDTPSTIWFNSPNGFTRRVSTNYYHYANCGSIDGRMADLGRTIQGDFNGDGMSDFLVINSYNNSVPSQLIYSRGDGTFYIQNSLSFYVGNSVASVVLDTNRIKVSDLNGDGMSDILYLNGYGSVAASTMYMNRGWGAFQQQQGPNYYIAGDVAQGNIDASRMTLTDVNGDGVAEMYFLGGANSAPATELRHLGLNPGERVTAITNGLGATTQITYRALTDPNLYTRTTGFSYPNTAVQGASYVVSVVSYPDGNGGQRLVGHGYAGAAVNLHGRGFLGFSSRAEFDYGTRITTTTNYRQDYPYIGLPSIVTTKTESGTIIGEEITNYSSRNITATNGSVRYFPYVSSLIERIYEINAPGTVVRSVKTTNSYGEPDSAFYGNLTASSVETRPGREDSGATAFVTSTTNQYDNFTSSWLLGRLKRVSVTKSGPSQASVARTSAFEYDAVTGLLTAEVVEPNSSTMMLRKSYLRDSVGNIYQTTLSANGLTSRTSTVTFDSNRQFPISSRNALGHTTTAVYDTATGNVTQSTDPNGLTTRWQFDGFGRKTKEIRADGTFTTWSRAWGSGSFYVPNGVYNISTASSDGSAAAAVYDVVERPVGTQSLAFSGSTNRTLTRYDGAGRMQSRTAPFSNNDSACSSTWTYDPIGRPKTMTMPDNGGNCAGRVAQYGYGIRTNSTTDPLGRVTSQEVDALGRVIRTIDANGTNTYFAYDVYDNQTRVTDGLGNSTTLSYDIRGRKVLMNDPDMGVWSYGYNAFGELVTQTDAKGQVVNHTYDVLGRMTARSEPEGNSYWWYDADSAGINCWKGGLCESINPNGRAHKLFKYDSLGRLSSLADTIGQFTSTGLPPVSAVALPVQPPPVDTESSAICPLTDPACLGRLLPGTNTSGLPSNPHSLISRYTYDGQSRISTARYGDEITIGYSYTSRGYLEKIYNQYSYLPIWTAQAHDARGNVTQYRQGNNVSTLRNYDDGTGELDAIYANGPSGVVQNLNYQHDRIGNITRRIDNRQNGKSETFGYDALNRLVGNSVLGGESQTFRYNAIGNITFRTGIGNYRYGIKPHAVTAVSDGTATAFAEYKYGVDFQYDANGNLLVGAGRIYTWNSFNKPEQIQRGAEGSRFEYDADRARVLEIQTRITDNLPQVTEILTSGVYERRITTNGVLEDRVHVSAGGELVAMVTTSGAELITPGADTAQVAAVRYLHTDHQGSIEAVTDSSGVVLDRTSFDAFGARRMPDWSSDPDYSEAKRSHPTDRGYTGHHEPDHLQLIHMNGRVYDPYLGRFISADPYVQDPYSSQSLNRYSYVWNNPINATDPSGYFLKGLFKSVKNFLQDARRSIYSAAACAAGAYAGGPAGCGAAVGAYNAYAVKDSGGSTTQALRTGVITGVTAYATQSIRVGLPAGSAQAAAASGFVQGTSSVLQGGNFFRGFATGAINSAVPLPDNPIGAALVSAAVGGTTSVISGGKFANGAINAAYFYALGEIASAAVSRIASSDPVMVASNDDALVMSDANVDMPMYGGSPLGILALAPLGKALRIITRALGFNSQLTVDELINSAGPYEKLGKGVLQGNIKGDASAIVEQLAQGAQRSGPRGYTLRDGTYVGTHPSSTPGANYGRPTIDINRNGTIYKIRVDP